jgi:hypothetical protein
MFQYFRLLIINPADFDLMGITFCDMYYVDKCLPFGCASSCQFFERFSSFLHWLVQYTSGIETLDHYLDDFIFAWSESNNNCKIAGFIIRSLNACRMSIFPIVALLPNDQIISTTLSNEEQLTRRKSSCMKSFTLLPLGKDKCDMRRPTTRNELMQSYY